MNHRMTMRHVAIASCFSLATLVAIGQTSNAFDARYAKYDLENLNRVGRAVMQYVQDSDDVLPLAYGRARNGAYTTNRAHYVPADWPSGQGGDTFYEDRIVASPTFWANAVLPYLPQNTSYYSPGMRLFYLSADLAANDLGRRQMPVSYTYVGTLSSWPMSAVAGPSTMPVLWHGLGRGATAASGLASPILFCNVVSQPCQYVPKVAGCSSALNGQTSSLLSPLARMRVYERAAAWMTLSLQARTRPLAAKLRPDQTDPDVDPFDQYEANYIPGLYWWDNCHPLLFRPDVINRF